MASQAYSLTIANSAPVSTAVVRRGHAAVSIPVTITNTAIPNGSLASPIRLPHVAGATGVFTWSSDNLPLVCRSLRMAYHWNPQARSITGVKITAADIDGFGSGSATFTITITGV